MKLIQTDRSHFKQLFVEFIRYENILDQIQLLRLLRQMIYICDITALKQEFLNKNHCLIQSDIHPRFKKYFELKSDFLNTNQFKLYQSTNIIESENRKMRIRSPLQTKLILLFDNKTSISVEFAIQYLYQEDLSIYSFEKLRSLVHRLNQSLTNQFGIATMFKFQDYHLEFQLNQSIICID